MSPDPLDASGHVTSRDPVLGTDEVVVTARWGGPVPEGLEPGRPDVVVVGPDGRVVLRETADKPTAFGLAEGEGRAVPRVVNVFRRAAPAVDDAVVRRLARAVREAEHAAGVPVQATWTLVAGDVVLHDVRPLDAG